MKKNVLIMLSLLTLNLNALAQDETKDYYDHWNSPNKKEMRLLLLKANYVEKIEGIKDCLEKGDIKPSKKGDDQLNFALFTATQCM